MAIGDLAFLTGRWQGQGFIMEFGTAAGTMLFGSMQAFEGGRTVYWENFRFAEETGDLVCYSLQRDAPGGRYLLVRFIKTSETVVSFENPADTGRKRIAFSVMSGSDELTMTQEGERNGAPVRQDWALRKLK